MNDFLEKYKEFRNTFKHDNGEIAYDDLNDCISDFISGFSGGELVYILEEMLKQK